MCTGGTVSVKEQQHQDILIHRHLSGSFRDSSGMINYLLFRVRYQLGKDLGRVWAVHRMSGPHHEPPFIACRSSRGEHLSHQAFPSSGWLRLQHLDYFYVCYVSRVQEHLWYIMMKDFQRCVYTVTSARGQRSDNTPNDSQ